MVLSIRVAGAVSVSDLGKYLKRWRLAHGMSQGDFGMRVGRNQNYISRLEKATDDYPLPDSRTLKLMAHEIGISLNELLEIAGYVDDREPQTAVHAMSEGNVRINHLPPRAQRIVRRLVAEFEAEEDDQGL